MPITVGVGLHDDVKHVVTEPAMPESQPTTTINVDSENIAEAAAKILKLKVDEATARGAAPAEYQSDK